MPLGILSDVDFEKELSKAISTPETKPETKTKAEPKAEAEPKTGSVDLDLEAIIQNLPEMGRPEGKKNLDNDIRKFLAEELIEGSRAEEVSKEFEVSPSSLASYKKGATSTATYNEAPKSKDAKELKEHVNRVRERITRKATKTLSSALGHLTDDKIANSKANHISAIAKDMSAIIRNMNPPEQVNQGPAVQFIMMVPRQRSEMDYESVQVVDAE